MVEDRRTLRIAAVVAAVYFVLAAAAIELTRLSGGVALVWLANGVLLAAIGPLRPSRWAVMIGAAFVASVLATFALRGHAVAAFGFAVANIVEPVAAIALLRHWRAQRSMFEDLNSVLMFALAAGVIGPALGAPIGAATAYFCFGNDPATAAFDWWLGHGLGMLIAAPLAITVTLPELRRGWRQPQAVEIAVFVGLIGLVAVTSFVVFAQDRLPLLFVPALPVMIATFRLGRIGAAAGLVVVAVIGGALTLAGHGPVSLVDGTNAFRLQFFQFYVGILFLLALPTAAMLTRERKLTARVRESEAALRLLADHSSDVLLNLDLDGAIRFASPSVRALGGYEPAELIGRNALDLIEPEHRALVQRAHLDALAAPETNVTVEYKARREDGSIAWFETNTRAIRGSDGGLAGVVSAIRDVSHRKSVERQLRLAADTDALTGLANRRPFLAALDAAIAVADAQPAAIGLIDLDHFKRVNDQHGHAAGDAALMAVAEACRRELRDADLVARLGGEEFAVLMRGVEPGEAWAACERLRLAIAGQRIVVPGGAAAARLFRVTASFGLIEVASDATGAELLAAADAALYAAKEAGRNQVKIAA